VLDAGCGTGRITAKLLERLPQGRVIALDLSENMLRTARGFLLPRSGGRVSFVCADLQALPFCDHFDGIFSTAAFHWAKEHPRLFVELYGALKPGGWLVAQCGGGANLARLRRHAAAVMALPEFGGFFAGWSEPWEYASAEVTADRLTAAGFVEVKTWLEPGGFSLPDESTFKQYLATVTLQRHLECLPTDNLRDQFLSAIVLRAQAEPALELDYWRLNLEARKR
jgi:trans-aconitate methyltransferase